MQVWKVDWGSKGGPLFKKNKTKQKSQTNKNKNQVILPQVEPPLPSTVFWENAIHRPMQNESYSINRNTDVRTVALN